MSKKKKTRTPDLYTSEETLELSNELYGVFKELNYPHEDSLMLITAIGNMLMDKHYHKIREKKSMPKYTVVVPVSGTKVTTNVKGEVVGIPFLGESERFIMKEDEFKDWLDAWITDRAMGRTFYVERHGR